MSTVGLGIGHDISDGKLVSFCGDHRALAAIQRACNVNAYPLIVAVVEDWQVIGRNCPSQGGLP
ncbi:MAG: hypothetical protein QOI07_3253 [Verrucomicrobiota bacterium]